MNSAIILWFVPSVLRDVPGAADGARAEIIR